MEHKSFFILTQSYKAYNSSSIVVVIFYQHGVHACSKIGAGEGWTCDFVKLVRVGKRACPTCDGKFENQLPFFFPLALDRE